MRPRVLVITVQTSQPFVVCVASGFFERRQIHPLLLLVGLIFRARANEQFEHPDLVSNPAKPSKEGSYCTRGSLELLRLKFADLVV